MALYLQGKNSWLGIGLTGCKISCGLCKTVV